MTHIKQKNDDDDNDDGDDHYQISSYQLTLVKAP